MPEQIKPVDDGQPVRFQLGNLAPAALPLRQKALRSVTLKARILALKLTKATSCSRLLPPDLEQQVFGLGAKAMKLLQARLDEAERVKRETETAATRRQLVGSGDRSERIRTYNFPQGRVTDHRINLTLYQLERVLTGDLDAVVEPLRAEYQADLLASLSEEGLG